MQKLAIQFAYEGTDYCGWQSQPGTGKKPSIEETLKNAIADLCHEKVQVVASGRTDAGVHASGQVAHFILNQNIEVNENLLRGLNHRLPRSIRIHQLGKVPDEFKAPSACRKQYSYYFQQGPANLPHLKNYTMWNHYPLDWKSMSNAVEVLVGTHDFFTFSGSGNHLSTTERTIYEAEITREPVPLPGCFDPEHQHLIRVRLVGSGFLKHMVRSIAGTLKQIGEKTRPASDLSRCLESRQREMAGPTAPANGLWLDRVWYPKQEGIDFLHQLPSRPRT